MLIGKSWTFSLNCKSLSPSSWKKDGGLIPSHIDWTPEKIKIFNAKKEDSGLYSCIPVESEEGTKEVVQYHIIVASELCQFRR